MNNNYQDIRASIQALCATFPAEYHRQIDEVRGYPKDFVNALTKAGWLAALIPEKYGGSGLGLAEASVIMEEINRSGGNAAACRGQMYNMNTLLKHGSEAQKQRYLPGIARGELRLQSMAVTEPSTGTDTTKLRTTAVRKGDKYVINGQKVWTTLGHLAKWGLLVTRTDPNAPKHRGLTFFIVDMESVGVEVRPLRQITGEAEFNEVYFTDTKIPKENILGGLGEGWRVSLATLMNERVAIGGNVRERGSGAPGHLVQIWKDKDLKDPIQKDKLIELWIQQEAVRLTNIRASELREKGTPGPEGSTSKLYEAEINKASYEFGMELLGNDGLLFPRGYSLTQPELNFDNDTFGFTDTQSLFLRSRANSIEGGTSEIMRNIIAERVLGLPGEQKLDKDKPWKDIPRS